MHILITNDDGIHAEGIAKFFGDDIGVVAPEKDQSGVSYALTLSNPLRIRKIDERYDGRRLPYFWLYFMGDNKQYAEGSDAFAIGKSKISITSLHLDLTVYDEISGLKKIFN